MRDNRAEIPQPMMARVWNVSSMSTGPFGVSVVMYLLRFEECPGSMSLVSIVMRRDDKDPDID